MSLSATLTIEASMMAMTRPSITVKVSIGMFGSTTAGVSARG